MSRSVDDEPPLLCARSHHSSTVMGRGPSRAHFPARRHVMQGSRKSRQIQRVAHAEASLHNSFHYRTTVPDVPTLTILTASASPPTTSSSRRSLRFSPRTEPPNSASVTVPARTDPHRQTWPKPRSPQRTRSWRGSLRIPYGLVFSLARVGAAVRYEAMGRGDSASGVETPGRPSARHFGGVAAPGPVKRVFGVGNGELVVS
ncbi:hypothetical protein B0H14DRAFT_3490565 [Mycena olivaceomarginata]|nr:hypothetical protein B0H14DRAFT_3490565 [Mycena olivaceomarginata]